MAELLKLRKRPAMWVIGALLAVSLLFFGYIIIYIFVINAPESQDLPQQAREGAVESLLPPEVLVILTSNFANLGTALTLVLGALAVGSEYGWDTYKVSLTQRPSRLELFTGKLLALGMVLAILTAVMFALSAAASYTVALVENQTIEWPAIMELLKGFGAGWLMLATFAAMGVFLASLFRGSALAIGIGLVYLLVFESLFTRLASQSDRVEAIGSFLPFKNSVDLAEHFGESPVGFISTPVGEAVEPLRATLTLVAYGIVFLLISILLFNKRDVS